MAKSPKLLDQPLVMYLVIASFSFIAAYVLWMMGGSLANVVSAAPVYGFTLELGGAIAGFMSVFLISLRGFKHLHALSRTESPLRKLRVFLIPRDQFRSNVTYSCEVSIFDEEEGEDRTIPVNPHREAGYLTIDLRDLRDHDRFRIIVRNSANQEWRSEYCPVAASKAEMQRI